MGEEIKKNSEEKSKKINFSKQGKKNRAAGGKFEAKVRADLEKLGWVVSKWMNTIDYNREDGTGKIVPAKRKYNPFMKIMTIGVGFPDFVCFRRTETGDNFEVIGLEVKSNGYLDQIEKGMCYWLIENKVFSRILIARVAKEKEGKKAGIEYMDFVEKYNKKQ
jgi:hypothetical protein